MKRFGETPIEYVYGIIFGFIADPKTTLSVLLASKRFNEIGRRKLYLFNEGGSRFLLQACDQNCAAYVEDLMRNGKVDPSMCDNYAVQFAGEYGHPELMRMLLCDPRVDPSAEDNHALEYASRKGYEEIVRILLTDLRVDPNIALISASDKGNLNVVKLLLADPKLNTGGRTMVLSQIFAYRAGHDEILRLLEQKIRIDGGDLVYH